MPPKGEPLATEAEHPEALTGLPAPDPARPGARTKADHRPHLRPICCKGSSIPSRLISGLCFFVVLLEAKTEETNGSETTQRKGADYGKTPSLLGFIGVLSGARGGTRTRTVLLLRDFKSLASTDFATRANSIGQFF